MPHRSVAVGVLLMTLASACAVASKADNSVTGAGKDIQTNVDPAIFSDPTTIDNPYWPLEPGTRWTWQGHAFEDGERVERNIVFTMTDLTKVIAGVTTAVGWDRDIDDGQLLEGELIFLAQDDEGNVWHFGQYRESWDGSELDGGRAWLVGEIEGAEAGIMMKAEHAVGDPDYSQGFAPPPYNWDDRAVVEKVGQRVCVTAGCYDDVIVIREFEPSKPNAWQLKYYAPGVGNIKVGWGGEDDEREVLELVSMEKLSESEMEEVRREAYTLEQRANLYSGTPPLELLG